MMRTAPDREWEPAIRDDASKQNSEYQRLMLELQERELGPEDYDILLKLEQASTCVPQHRFLAQSFIDAFKPPAEYFTYAKVYCCFCEFEITDRDQGL